MAKLHWVSMSAIHEAGHVVMAQRFGVRNIAVRQHARRDQPGMEASLGGLDIHELVLVLLAGMAAERHMAREYGEEISLKNLRHVGRGDLAFLRWLGIRVIDLERALALTEEELVQQWQEVLRTAVAIQQSWNRGEDWEEGTP